MKGSNDANGSEFMTDDEDCLEEVCGVHELFTLEGGKILVNYEESLEGLFSTPFLDSVVRAIRELDMEGWYISEMTGSKNQQSKSQQDPSMSQSFVANSVSQNQSCFPCPLTHDSPNLCSSINKSSDSVPMHLENLLSHVPQPIDNTHCENVELGISWQKRALGWEV